MTKRQFIAGAKCPKCAQEDTVIQIRDDKKIRFECVRCDFKQRSDQPLQPDNNKTSEVKFIRNKKQNKT